MTEVTESTPEETGQNPQSRKKANQSIKGQPKPNAAARRRAPASGQQEQRDTTINRSPQVRATIPRIESQPKQRTAGIEASRSSILSAVS